MKTKREILLEQVPPEFKSVFSYYAYDKGHYAGEEEELITLENLISEFKPAIDKFELRLTKRGN